MFPHHLQLHRPAMVNKECFGSAAAKELSSRDVYQNRGRKMAELEGSTMIAMMAAEGSRQPLV